MGPEMPLWSSLYWRKHKNNISEHKTAICTGNVEYGIAKHYYEVKHGSPSIFI